MHETPLLFIGIPQAQLRYGVGRSKLYELLAQGFIEARKCGSRTLISVASADSYFAALPLIKAR
jgi:hypothetical protein